MQAKKMIKWMMSLVVAMPYLEATIFNVTSESNDSGDAATLAYALVNLSPGSSADTNTIIISPGLTISLSGTSGGSANPLPAITQGVTIIGTGGGATPIIDGSMSGTAAYQAISVASGTVVIQNVNIQNALSKGGDGGPQGGGGVGGGGALYVHGGTNVTLSFIDFSGNVAQGGNGGIYGNSGGGGGGFGGGEGAGGGGGGGGGHSGGGGGAGFGAAGGNGIFFGGGGGGGGGPGPGGGGGGGASNGHSGGGGGPGPGGGGGAGAGGNGFDAVDFIGGTGGNGLGSDLAFGGGGGGGAGGGGEGAGGGGGGASSDDTGGSGGALGGGGGAGGYNSGIRGGSGGFGAGGGAGAIGGSGGVFGGDGGADGTTILYGGGGGGAGLGGAVFIQNNATLTFLDGISFSENSVIAGQGGSSQSPGTDGGSGQAFGEDIFLRSGGNLVVNISTTPLTISSSIASDQGEGGGSGGGLTKEGAAALTLSGTNTYSGITLISAGVLNVSADTGLGSSDTALILAGGTLQYGAAFTLSDTRALTTTDDSSGIDTNGNDVTIFNSISGTGGIVKIGSGILTLSGTNTYSGITVIDTGTMQAGSLNAFSSSSFMNLASFGAVLDLQGYSNSILELSGTTGSKVLLGAGTLTLLGSVDPTFAGDITGTGGLVKDGSDTFTLTGTGNTYSGTTVINDGAVQAGVANAFSANSLVNIAGTTGVLDLNGFTNTIANLIGTTGSLVTLNGGTLTFGGDEGSQTFLGGITGTGASGLVKKGTGTFTLAGLDNTYDGTTTVVEGTFQAGAEDAFSPNSLVNLSESGTTLDLNNWNNTILNLTGTSGTNILLGTATLTFGDGTDQTFSGGITGTGGGLVKQGAGVFTLEYSDLSTYAGTTTVVEGTFQAGSGYVFSESSLFDLASSGATLDLHDHDNSILNLTGTTGSEVLLEGATLTFGDATNQTFFGNITGSSGGGLTKQGTGTFTLAGLESTYDGTTTVVEGTFQAGAEDAFSPNSPINLLFSAVLDLNGFDNTVSVVTGTTGSLIELGSNTLTLTNPSGDFGGSLTGTGGGLTLDGAGTFVLTGDENTYSGTTLIERGTLRAGINDAFSSYSLVDLTESGAELNLDGYGTTILNLTGTTGSIVDLNGGRLTFGDGTDQTFFGNITGSSGVNSLFKEGAGIFTPAGDSNTYAGATYVDEGVFQAAAENAFSPNSVIYVSSGAVLDLDNFDNVILNLEGDSGSSVLLGAGTLTLGDGEDYDFSGSITGTGGLTKVGTGTFTLSGTGNTYSGTTLVEEGTFQAGIANGFSSFSVVNLAGTEAVLDLDGYDNTIANLTGTVGSLVTLGSGTLTVGGDNGSNTFEGNIFGEGGGLIKVGIGTLTLTGTSSYTGGTTIAAGTLAGSTLSLQGDILNDSALVFSQPGICTYAGNITGIGTVDFLGGREVYFTGTGNAYTGSTTIIGGELVAGGNNVFSPDSAVFLSEGGSLFFAGFANTIADLSGDSTTFVYLGTNGSITVGGDNGSQTFAGIVSGTGASFIKVGSGTLTLTGTNTFTGLSEVRDGTLITSVNSQPTDIVNNSVLIFNETSDALYGWNITGSGAFNKTGDGLLTITGDVIQGSATVEEGGLKVGITGDLFVTGTLTVDAGATLGGCGRIVAGDGIVIDGDLTPGCSATLFTMVGAVKMNDESTFHENIQGIGYPVLNVEGTVNLDPPTLNINLSGDVTPLYGERVAFITTTGGLTGTFGDILINSAVVKPIISYDAYSAYFELHPGSFVHFSATGNAGSVARALDEIIASGSGVMDSVIGQLALIETEAQLDYTLDQMQPALYKGLAISQESSAMQVQGALSFRMQTVLDETYCYAVFEKDENGKKVGECKNVIEPVHTWVSGIGDILNQSSNTYADSPQVGYQDTTTGVVTGVDYRFGKYVYLGVLGAYTYSNIDWRNEQGRGDIKTGYGGLYLSGISDVFYGNLAVTGSWSRYHAYRDVYFPSTTYTAKNNHGGAQLLTHLDTGINLGWKGLTVRPFDSFDYITQTENKFTETGAGELDLNVAGTNAILLRNELGINFAGCLCMGSSKWTIAPKLSWVREVRIKGSMYNCEFVNTDAPFTVTGYFPDRGLFSPGVTVNGSMRNDLLNVGLYYNGEFTHGYSNHRYGAQLRFGF